MTTTTTTTVVRRLSFLLVLLTLLTACGQAAPAAPVPTDAPAAAPMDAPNTAPAATGETRMITHALGASEIPANPQRIAVVGYNEVEELLALGITPIAKLYQTPAHFPPDAEQIPLIGNDAGQPNLEQLLELKPDLIVGPDWALTEQYDLLAQIAPTVVVPRGSFAEWQTALRFTADLVGRTAQAEELIAAYNQRVAAVRDAIGAERLAELEVTAFRPYTDGSGFLIWVDRSFADVILADVGIKRPEAQRAALPEGEERINDLSLEFIPLLDADAIFFALPESGSFAAGANEGLDTWLTSIETSPLWAQLRAVQNEQVFKVDAAVWNEGSIIGANALLDDLERYLGNEALAAAPAADPLALQVLEETSEYRLIKHSLGETRVPLQPQRIVTLQDQNMLLPLLELGVGEVVGSVGSIGANGAQIFRRTADYDTAGVSFVGEYGTPNLEAIAALNPDLILGDQYEITPEKYDLFSQIAPTVVIEQFTRPVWTVMDDLALLTNRQQQAADLKERYDARVAAVQAKLGDPAAITLSVITPYNATFYFDASAYDNGVTVIRDLGMHIPALHEQAIAQGDYPSYSMELLPQADGDALFLLDYNAEGSSGEYDVENIRRSALFETLNAVRKSQVFVIDPLRMGGVSYGGLLGMLDAIEQHLTGKSLDTSWEPVP
jgi:iron complex transport system substrate-binding protein